MTNVVCSSKETDVNIGKLGDAKALEDGYVHQADTLTNDLHILPTVEKRVAGSREPPWHLSAPRSARGTGGGLERAG